MPADIEGGGRADPEKVATRVAALIDAAGGRALVLSPSLARLRQLHAMVRDRIPYPLLCQGEAARDVLLERFRTDETSVLFASMTFWQGVDIPGRSLELVILESLPFAVPDDPLIAAKSERAERDGGSGFKDVALPHAALLLKQGFGRLLRSERQYGYATRSFTLGSPVDEGKADAKYENGVLELTLPKQVAGSARRISIA